MSEPPAAGLYPPLPTFFKADNYTVDYETQAKHTKFLIDNGLTGVTVNGSTGENAHLTREERFKLVQTVREAAGPKATVIAGVAENSIEGALAEIESVKKAGANFALTVCANYFGGSTTQEGIVSWFTKVADKAALPVMIYLFPGVTNGIVISDKSFEILAQHPNIVGAKFTYTDLSLFVKVNLNKTIQKAKFTVFPGFSNFLLPAFSVKSGGLIDGLANIFPKSVNKLLQYGLKGDFGPEAQELQYLVTMAEQPLVDGGCLATKVAIKKFTGFGESVVGRPPLDRTFVISAASDEDCEKLAAFEKTL